MRKFQVVIVATCASIGLLTMGVGAASAAPGSTVLHGTFASNAIVVMNGTPTNFFLVCDEQRVQFADGSAKDSFHCTVDPGQTLPTSAVPFIAPHPAFWISDFFGSPGFSGVPSTYDYQGVLTPSGIANGNANYPAP